MAVIGTDFLTFQEFAMRETLPLSKIHQAVLEFLQGRDDAVLFGAQAVNAYVSEPQMTQEVDLLSTGADELAEELKKFLSAKFHIAVRVRAIADGKGFRIYQIRSDGNRHLVDVRMVSELPAAETIENVRVLSPLELIASKIVSFHSRKGKPKAGTDWRDLAVLLLKFPELKEKVSENLQSKNVGEDVLYTWYDIENQDIRLADEDEDLIF